MEVRVTKCRSCQAEIVWTRTPKGKNMPIDATPVPDGEWMLEEGSDGKPDAVSATNVRGALNGDMARYQSHFKSCPNASEHSKGKERSQPTHPQRGKPGATDAASRIVELTAEVEDLRAKVAVARKAFSRWAATDSAEGCAACEAVQAIFDEQKAKREAKAK